MSEELNLCPFCGGDVTFKEQSVYGVRGIRVSCTKCHISTTLYQEGFMHGMNVETKHSFEECKEHAIVAWNTRTDQEKDRLQQENEQLKELLRLAVKDTPHICQNCLNIINTDNKYFCPLVNATNPQYGGSAQWGKCMWQWQHEEKLKGVI